MARHGVVEYWPSLENFSHLKGELEAVASEELVDVLRYWGMFRRSEANQLRDYLSSELRAFGALSMEKVWHTAGKSHTRKNMQRVRGEARVVLTKLFT